MTREPRIAFIGIGNMGLPMVRCIVNAGLEATVFDARRDALVPLAGAARVRIAASLPAAAAAADMAVTMLPDSKAVRAVVLGSERGPGLVEGLARGALVIDMSSSYPLDTVALGAELARRDVGLIDAPVSGGVPKAVAGTLAIMAGGEAALVDRAMPLLATMGTVHRTGRLGSGHAMKALNNYVSAAGLIATCEALVVGQRFGLDAATMTRILNASTGRNNTTENKVERYMLSGKFDSGFALALMEKDVGMAKALAAELGVAAGGLDFVTGLLKEAASSLGTDADHTAVYSYVEGSAG